MNGYDEQLRAIVASVTFAADGRAVVADARGGNREVPVATERGPFMGLAEALYAGHYNVLHDHAPPGAIDGEAFLAELRAANCIQQRSVNAVPVQRDSITGPGGHFVMFGRPIHAPQSGRQVRFYWNIDVSGATTFVREITTRFERARIPFQAKLPLHPLGFARTDAGVLYLGDDDVDVGAEAIAATYDALGGTLRDAVPLFSLRLAPGLSFAESPPNGDSFGMHRCDLIAEGLVQAHERAAPDVEARLAVVRERLTVYGLDVARLACNPTSRYPYRFGTFGPTDTGEAA